MSVPSGPPRSVRWLRKKYEAAEPLVMLTAYDYTFARFADAAGVDILLVGDSLAQVIQGQASTLPVTLDEMIYHARAVRRGAAEAFIVLDMPFMSYQSGPEDALRNVGRALKEGLASAVKLEGGSEIAPLVERLVQAGIPVMGHIGLMPQHVYQEGYRQHGGSVDEAARLKVSAQALAAAGAFALVIEGTEEALAADITASLAIPTIGIGAGAGCNGQVLVVHDVLGLTHYPGGNKPKFVREYAQLRNTIAEALYAFVTDVKKRKFPG